MNGNLQVQLRYHHVYSRVALYNLSLWPNVLVVVHSVDQINQNLSCSGSTTHMLSGSYLVCVVSQGIGSNCCQILLVEHQEPRYVSLYVALRARVRLLQLKEPSLTCFILVVHVVLCGIYHQFSSAESQVLCVSISSRLEFQMHVICEVP